MKLTTAQLRDLIREALLLEILEEDEMSIEVWKTKAGNLANHRSGSDQHAQFIDLYRDNKFKELGDPRADKIYMKLIKAMM